MTRHLTVAAAAFLAVASLAVWTQDASAFTTARRLCVSRARTVLKNGVRDCRVNATTQFNNTLRACFNDPVGGCVSQCQTTQTNCQGTSDHPGPNQTKDHCANSDNIGTADDDHFTSCAEQFGLDVDACGAAQDNCTADVNTCATQALTCAQNARLARFNCTQACAAQVQKAFDDCNTQFNDCLEGCG